MLFVCPNPSTRRVTQRTLTHGKFLFSALLKGLLHSAQGIRTPDNAHGKLVMQLPLESLLLEQGLDSFPLLNLHVTSFDVHHYGERSAPALNCRSTKTDGHLDRMHGYDYRVQGIESGIPLGDFFKHTPLHVSG